MNQREELAKFLKESRGNIEITEMALKQYSELFFYKYQTLITVGFTEEQAFELVKHRGLA